MTDEQVIKALECCVYWNCKECPCFVDKGNCTRKSDRELLNLINRQKEEIERLQSLCSSKDAIINSQEAEIRQNENRFPHFTEDTQVVSVSKKADGQYYADRVTTIQVDKIRAEAYKEFAERLKEKMDINSSGYILITEMTLDNLLKEMTEESNGE